MRIEKKAERRDKVERNREREREQERETSKCGEREQTLVGEGQVEEGR